jgi:hypothetical protein
LKTQVLKSIQIPNRTLDLLDSFAAHVLHVPDSARRITRLDDLPPQLRRHIGVGPDKQYVWFAWCSGEQVSLVTGAFSLELSRERGRPVLEVRTDDADGLLEEAATWVRTGTSEWARCQY